MPFILFWPNQNQPKNPNFSSVIAKMKVFLIINYMIINYYKYQSLTMKLAKCQIRKIFYWQLLYKIRFFFFFGVSERKTLQCRYHCLNDSISFVNISCQKKIVYSSHCLLLNMRHSVARIQKGGSIL